ncbi:MAG: SMC-Scp complex subunit ScpB [Clostridia bacterium]|nr:SMC-Scp complex subunit ScpB [Clostridia bacterium]
MPMNIIEALIFASGHGMHKDDLYKGLKDYTRKQIDNALIALKEQYSDNKGIHLICANNVYQFQSNPAYGDLLADLLLETRERELSKTLLQVLAIIAYKQPVTRTEIEDLRGVGSDYVIAMLLKLNLIEAVGRKETIGRPVLYGTTLEFLRKFGLESLDELPDYEDLMLKIRNNFEKYYAKTDSLYRERDIELEDKARNEAAAAEAPEEAEDDFFVEETDDDIPDFLSGEDIVEID